MNTDLLIKQFEFTQCGMQANLQGFTHEDSMKPPRPAGNCLNWLLGHIVCCRRDIMRLVEKPWPWDKEKYARYGNGSPPLTDDAPALPLETIIQDFNSTQEAIIAGLQKISTDWLQTALGNETVGSMLAGLQFHEAYHVGQLGLLRRLAGKKGAMER